MLDRAGHERAGRAGLGSGAESGWGQGQDSAGGGGGCGRAGGTCVFLHNTCIKIGLNATSELFVDGKIRYFSSDFSREIPDFPLNIQDFFRGKNSANSREARRRKQGTVLGPQQQALDGLDDDQTADGSGGPDDDQQPRAWRRTQAEF